MKKMVFILGPLIFSSCGPRDVADRDGYDDHPRDDYRDDHRYEDDNRYDRNNQKPWWAR